MADEDDDDVRVLIVDDNRTHAQMTAVYLEDISERFATTVATSASEGLELLEGDGYQCVVSDYDMPGRTGIEFLDAMRAAGIDIPFILFTGKGSEEIASDAISAGATDYIQKDAGASQFDVLANRIEHAVSEHEARRELEETTRFYGMILRHSSDYVMIVDGMGRVRYISPAVEPMLGYTPEEVEGMVAFELVHPDDRPRAAETLTEILEEPDQELTVEFRARNADGGYQWLEVRGRNLLDDPVIEGVLVNVRDITKRKEREQALEREKARLTDLTEHLSHDVRNQLNVIESRIELAREETDTDHLAQAQGAVDRVNEMLNKTMELAESGRLTAEPTATSLRATAMDCWSNVGVEAASFDVTGDIEFYADESRLRRLLENLLLNAIEHAGPDVSIEVGPLDDGFYVEDDGPGIPADARDRVFESGYTTSDGRSGLGLRIVSAIAEAHDWTVELAEGETGARFEIRGVATVD